MYVAFEKNLDYMIYFLCLILCVLFQLIWKVCVYSQFPIIRNDKTDFSFSLGIDFYFKLIYLNIY